MSSDQTAIRVHDISKHYLVFDRPEDRLKQMVVPGLKRLLGLKASQYYRSFASLSGVSFSVSRGETVGIVGRNGSGKSTLLQIICGTLSPTSGTIEVNGRIAALLELGAGFNPDFTGRENVYLNAAILGLTQSEINERFDSIVRFADIGAFIDQPVRTYSSGMYVRLAFATAVNVDPDILVVDEALAVGDEAFQRKCYARIEEIKERGGTVLFVSHNAQSVVQLCDRALLIDAGELILEGIPKTVVQQYQRLINMDHSLAATARQEVRAIGTAIASTPTAASDTPAEKASNDAYYDPSMPSPTETRFQSRGAMLRDVRIETLQKKRVNTISMGRRYRLAYEVAFAEHAEDVAFGFIISTPTGLNLAGVGTSKSRLYRIEKVHSGTTVGVVFDFDCRLAPGTYFITAGVSARGTEDREYIDRVLDGSMFKILPEGNCILSGHVDLNVTPSFTIDGQAGARNGTNA